MIKEHEGKQYFKKIMSIEKFDDAKILIGRRLYIAK